MRLKQPMVKSPTGKIHAINPETSKTYCGRVPTHNWHFLDVVPSDENKPTCSICSMNYDLPLIRRLRSIADDLKYSIDEYLDVRVILKDVAGLERFTKLIADYMQKERQRVEG